MKTLAVTVAVLSAGPAIRLIAQEPDTRSPAASVKALELADSRRAAVAELLAAESSAVPALIAAIDDPRDEVAITAIEILAMLGHRAAAAGTALQRLAKGEDPVRAHAAGWAQVQVVPQGVTLVAEYQSGTIRRLGEGLEDFFVGAQSGPFDVELLAQGGLLITTVMKPRIVVCNAAGDEVWSFAGVKQPLDVDRLSNGNTLIVDRELDGGKVFEIDRSGKVVWEFKSPKGGKEGLPQDATRLPGGHTIIVFYKSGVAIEVDRDGKEIWRIEGFSMLSDVDLLPNGNLLLARSRPGSVEEVTTAGEVVSTIKVGMRCSDADRLADGHTLVAAHDAVIEYDRAGKEVRRVPVAYAGEVARY